MCVCVRASAYDGLRAQARAERALVHCARTGYRHRHRLRRTLHRRLHRLHHGPRAHEVRDLLVFAACSPFRPRPRRAAVHVPDKWRSCSPHRRHLESTLPRHCGAAALRRCGTAAPCTDATTRVTAAAASRSHSTRGNQDTLEAMQIAYAVWALAITMGIVLHFPSRPANLPSLSAISRKALSAELAANDNGAKGDSDTGLDQKNPFAEAFRAQSVHSLTLLPAPRPHTHMSRALSLCLSPCFQCNALCLAAAGSCEPKDPTEGLCAPIRSTCACILRLAVCTCATSRRWLPWAVTVRHGVGTRPCARCPHGCMR